MPTDKETLPLVNHESVRPRVTGEAYHKISSPISSPVSSPVFSPVVNGDPNHAFLSSSSNSSDSSPNHHNTKSNHLLRNKRAAAVSVDVSLHDTCKRMTTSTEKRSRETSVLWRPVWMMQHNTRRRRCSGHPLYYYVILALFILRHYVVVVWELKGTRMYVACDIYCYVNGGKERTILLSIVAFSSVVDLRYWAFKHDYVRWRNKI